MIARRTRWCAITQCLAFTTACTGAEPHPAPDSSAPVVVGRLDASRAPPADAAALGDPAPTGDTNGVDEAVAATPTPEATPAPAGAPTAAPAPPIRFAKADDTPDASASETAAPSPPPAPSPGRTDPLQSGPASPRHRAMAREIQTQVSCLRGRPFREDVNVEFQSIEDFSAFVHREVEREKKSPRGRREARLVKAIGLVEFDEDLGAIMERATVEQAAAYYDPTKNTFFVVKSMPDLLLRSTMAHELQHALQDQHSSVLDDYTEGRFDTLDASLAARFVVEGEASLVGNAWTLMAASDIPLLGQVMPSPCGKGASAQLDREVFWRSLRDMHTKLATQSRRQIQNPGLLERMLTQALSPSVAESMRALDTLPNFAYYTMVPPYTFGSYAMYDVFARGGWAWPSIDALFETLPSSTAEVLHPERIGTDYTFTSPQLWRPREHPFEISGWRADPIDRVGELALRIVLINGGASEQQATAAASSWHGDSIRVWSRQRGGFASLAYDWNLHAATPAQAGELKLAVWDAIEGRHGAVDLLGEVSPIAGTEGVLVYGYNGPQGRRCFGRLAWSPSGLVLSEGWEAPPRGMKPSP